MNVVVFSVHLPNQNKDDALFLRLIKRMGVNVLSVFTEFASAIDDDYYFSEQKIEFVSQHLRIYDSVHAIFVNDELSYYQMCNLNDKLDLLVFSRSIASSFYFQAWSQNKEIISRANAVYADIFSKLVRQTLAAEEKKDDNEIVKKELEKEIHDLEKKLIDCTAEAESIKQKRILFRNSIEALPYPIVSLCGMFDSGKTTIYNTLCAMTSIDDKSPYNEKLLSQVFQMPTILIEIQGYPSFFLMDSVGTIEENELLVERCYAELLDDFNEASVLLFVVDVSSKDYEKQIDITRKCLSLLSLDAEEIFLYNKCDKIDKWPFIPDERSIYVSNQDTKEDKQFLVDLISKKLSASWRPFTMLLPYEKSLFHFKKEAYIDTINETDNGYLIKGKMSEKSYHKWREFIINDDDKD